MFLYINSVHMIHKVVTTSFYHILLKQLYLILSVDNLSFVPSVTTPQKWSLSLVPQILPTSVTLAHRSEFEVLFEQVTGTQTSSLPCCSLVPRNGSALGRYQRWWSQPCCHLLPAEALLTSLWSVFLPCEFILQL